jgi:GNAT superfamily N-acetyltransferase
MPKIELPSSSLRDLHAFAITEDHQEDLQRFFDENPEYFLAVHGEPADSNEAHEEIHGQLPAGWSFTRKWLVGYADPANELVAMANVVSDLLAPSVWHIGLFMVATARHGTGDAQAIYRGLEAWAVAHGARWLRLGVVQGNRRAERFWESVGFVQARVRVGVEMGKRTNTLRVMFKPLSGGTMAQYLSLIERDQPERQNAP